MSSLRFVAACLVVAQHASLIWADGQESAALLRPGFAAVSLFFMLSGFVLTWSGRPGTSARTFWRGRAARIYPTHLVALAGGILLLWTFGQDVPVRQWLPNALLVQTWSPHFNLLDAGVNPVSWSLCCEAAFYVVFPLLVRLANAIPAARLWRWAAAAMATTMLVPVLVTVLRPAVEGEPTFGYFPVTLHQMWLVYAFPLARLPEFLLGVLLARLVREGRAHGVRLWHGAVALAVVLPFQLRAPLLFSIAALTVIPFTAIMLGAVNSDVRSGPTLLRNRVLVWLGGVTFGLYMTHFLVIQNGYELLDPSHTAGALQKLLYTAVLLAAALTVAVLMYRCVELPMMRLLSGRRRAGARTGRETAVVPEPLVEALLPGRETPSKTEMQSEA
ncbi:acyltransferase [Streptomyces sp. BHT-5-2]|uniref:acyltransferase family protein n=1 Tax=unclassified Streptomyces TaxID=2593676 RepID=UPI001C8E5B17|nr:acyltransferase [Streptomyces sp. BHT-5-2]QZL04768.1 acyltransferase [Streptomyces sp. BHT-5-2]